MSEIKSGYITGTNQQLQAIRPYLVEQGFVDDTFWNDSLGWQERYNSIFIDKNETATLFPKHVSKAGGYTCIYSLSPDEDLKEAAEKIKEAFYKQ